MSHHQFLIKDEKTGKNVWVDADKLRQNAAPEIPHTPAYSESRPLVSQSLAVPRHMVDKYNAKYERHGLSVRHNEDGSLPLYSRRQRNELMRLRGYHDMDAGYGDWSGR